MRPVRPSAPFMTDCDGRGRPVNGFAALRKNFMHLHQWDMEMKSYWQIPTFLQGNSVKRSS